jgi:protein TonB
MAMLLGALATLAIGWGIGQLDLRHHERERAPMSVTLAPPPPPPPIQQIQRDEPQPEPAAPPEKKPPPEVRKVERKPLPQPKAPVAPPQETPKEPPRAETSPIPSEVGAAAPPKPSAAPAPARPAGAIVRGLVPIHKVEPKYPRRAQQAGIGGSFTCHLFIDPDGTVRDVKIIRGENQDLFAREIRAALMQWRFKPEGVDLIGEIDINFRLE